MGVVVVGHPVGRRGFETERVSPPALGKASRAAAAVHHHGGELAVDDLLFAVEVKHVDGGHLGGGAAWACGATGVGLVYQVGVRVLLQVHVITLP